MKRISCLLSIVFAMMVCFCSCDKDEQIVASEKNNLSINPFVNEPFYYHFNPTGFVKDENDNNVIPSESLADVELAARLGFKYIEANVQKTSDGHFICIHGIWISATDQRFDNHVISLDGTDVTTINIQKKNLSWIQDNIRYDSDIAKYRTTIPTLEEFCKCCKQNGIGILAGTKDLDAINICRTILGDNVIIYSLPLELRNEFNGYVFEWINNSGITKDILLNLGKMYGAPCILSISEQVISDLKKADTLDDFILEAHNNNFLVGAAAVYQSEATTIDCIKRGFDFLGSGHEVNNFVPNYEVYDINLDNLNGIVQDSILQLTAGQSISCGAKTSIIGKGILAIVFNGTLRIKFGSVGERIVSSDGQEIILSDYFYMRDTELIIEAVTDTTITNLVYKTSKC